MPSSKSSASPILNALAEEVVERIRIAAIQLIHYAGNVNSLIQLK